MASSMGTGATFSPPEVMMSSFTRPLKFRAKVIFYANQTWKGNVLLDLMVRNPSASMYPRSPVLIQPSSVKVALVSASCKKRTNLNYRFGKQGPHKFLTCTCFW